MKLPESNMPRPLVDSWPLYGLLDICVAGMTGLRRHESRRVFFGMSFALISVFSVALTWYAHALNNGGVKAALAVYEVQLPRISYMGASPPAYYLFCTMVPISALVLRAPFAKYLEILAHILRHDFGFPVHSSCWCFWCCCACCCDSDRRGIDARINQPTQFSDGSKYGCTCTPYLPYVVMAFRPCFEASIAGLLALAIVSIDFGNLGRGIHFLGSVGFFYGMIAVSGLWVHFQSRMVHLWPDKSKSLLGLDSSSFRYRLHIRLFYTTVAIVGGHDWIAWIVTYYYGAGTGNWTPFNFQYQYTTALSQWTVVALSALTMACFALDMDALPADDSVEAAGPKGDMEAGRFPRSYELAVSSHLPGKKLLNDVHARSAADLEKDRGKLLDFLKSAGLAEFSHK